uniref:Protein kinase domain-containing protein n=1 Tax=Kalanchoe fedtschenkoi TaxID=63787 RepID=A0A7N0TSY9_KALFE
MNVTSYKGLQPGDEVDLGSAAKDIGRLKLQDVGEGGVKIRLYEGRVAQGPQRGTPIIFKVYPGKRAGGVEADMMAANELSAHSFLQGDSIDHFQNIQILLGGFETSTGEQWLAFRDYGRYSAADYSKIASEKISRSRGESSWNRFETQQRTYRRSFFIMKLLYGAINGLAFMHDHDRLHQSLGPASIVLNTIAEREAAYLIPRLRDLAFSVDIRYSSLIESPDILSEALWRRANNAGVYSPMEKRDFGVADDIYEAGLLFAFLAFVPFCEAGVMDGLSLQRLLENTFRLDLEAMREYCSADDKLADAVNFLDLGDGAGWELLQAMLNPDFRKRPTARAALKHRWFSSLD